MKVVTFKCPEILVKLMDEAARELGFGGRGELIRTAIREFIEIHYLRKKPSEIQRSLKQIARIVE